MSATDELRRLLDERGVEWMPSAWSARDEMEERVSAIERKLNHRGER